MELSYLFYGSEENILLNDWTGRPTWSRNGKVFEACGFSEAQLWRVHGQAHHSHSS
jgi:hypothetical protein